MKNNKLEHRFVGSVPHAMENGILYISVDFATMMHLCACGCEREVVTPLSPKDWKFTFDGQSVSVNPSIGNWSLPCRSHYIINRSNVQWAENWTDEQINRGRQNDLIRKRGEAGLVIPPPEIIGPAPKPKLEKQGFLQRLWFWLRHQ